ncbi:MAG: DUF2807 domain-containing protein [Flavobacteriaceae bacterium]|nr:DUF2807 domain-containing protein [Flavobacteriaceae bacterium]
MKTLYKSMALLLFFVSATSCLFQGIKGNGHVVTENRNLIQKFTSLKVGQGIEVYLTTEDQTKIVVEADKNIMDLLRTEVENGTLRIYFSKQVRSASSKKVYLSTSFLSEINTSSGAFVKFENSLKADNLVLKASSGSGIHGTVFVTDLKCKASSGADIKLQGKAKNLKANASSGSDIKAYDLEVEYANARASSGASIKINVTKNIYAKSSSGGRVKYRGNPTQGSRTESKEMIVL